MSELFGIQGFVLMRRVDAQSHDIVESFFDDTLAITVPTAAISFSVDDHGTLTPGILNGIAISCTGYTYLSEGADVASVAHITHSGGLVSDVMVINSHIWADGQLIGFDAITLWMGGDPLPALTTPQEYYDWMAAASGFYEVLDSPNYSTGTPIWWEQFDIDPQFTGTAASERIAGTDWGDMIRAGDGADTVVGGTGNDTIIGGATSADLRDVVYAGAGDDSIDGGYGNDSLRGDDGNDTIEGGFGADTVVGGAGNDVLTGSAWSDQIFGNDGDDFINGGFGNDRLNGGAGADRFYHLGVAGHGSDWVQDYSGTDNDVLVFGNAAASLSQFQINWATTAGAGDAGVQEAFVVYRPTGQIMWALIDGAANDHIWLQIGANTYDLLA